MNLLADCWIPVRRAGGEVLSIHPAEITAGLGSDPIIALAWPRADFRIASLEFLIGLLASTRPPRDEEAWLDGWETPPPPDELASSFTPFANAFELDGPGPRFMQDCEELCADSEEPETLLIEAPGEQTRRRNTALLVKAGRVRRLSRPAAAIALYTLQTYAPAGGRGNLTSLRGGGPLTTLVQPGGERKSLWHILWANVPQGEPPAADDLPRVFPWLAATRTADRYPATTPVDAHPLQAFWGMPRRIRLDFSENTQNLPCDLTGEVDTVCLTGWRQRPNGVKYANWQHPLSPYYQPAKSQEWLPMHPQADGIGYRHWAAIALGAEGRRTARCIADWGPRRLDLPEGERRARLLVGGYDMDNMKARGFIESEVPLPGSDPEKTRALAHLARGLIEAASLTVNALRGAVRAACYDKKAAFDSAPFVTLSDAFWTRTEPVFFRTLDETEPDLDTALVAVGSGWRQLLSHTALALFDEAAPLDPSGASFNPRRIVDAKRNLLGTLEGHGALGKRLFEALTLPVPEKKTKARGRKAKE